MVQHILKLLWRIGAISNFKDGGRVQNILNAYGIALVSAIFLAKNNVHGCRV